MYVNRADENRLSLLESLPNEVKLMIVGNIGHAQSILKLAMTGPVFCAFITVHERIIAAETIKCFIPPELLHTAVATYAAMKSEWNVHSGASPTKNNFDLTEDYVKTIIDFMHKYRSAGGFTLQGEHPKGLSLDDASQYYAIHSSIYHFAYGFSCKAQSEIPKVLGFAPEITSTVLLRYQKALYITQLVAELFSWRGRDQTEGMHLAWGMFWYAFDPWEIEQVFSVQTMLKWYTINRLSQTAQFRDWPERLEQYDFMTRFANFNGPVRICSLELKGQMSTAYYYFRNLMNGMGVIYWPVCGPDFGLEIVLDKIGKRLSQAAEDGSPAFGDMDRGPMRNWYNLMLFRRLDRKFPRGGHPSFFSCMQCLVFSGYAFWDEIDETRQPAIPINKLHQWTAFTFHKAKGSMRPNLSCPTWFRSIQKCKCHEVEYPYRLTGHPPRHQQEYSNNILGEELAGKLERKR
ncbi:hypothetical protein F4859DRAFT_520169 [Xylaria cf. heliscus]|nr:hypothetical protein F4859DRAFT_520169 [Xylaria cf. heliscus]